MRVKLPESARDRKRSFGGTAVSTLVHALLVGGTVVATGYTTEQMTQPPQPERLVYVAPGRTPPQAPSRPETVRPAIPTNVDPVVSLPEAPRLNLLDVPSVLPSAHSLIGTVRQEDFRTAPRDSLPVRPVSDEPFTEVMVERVVRPRDGNPSPRYPSLLANAGVVGMLHAQFVVDTTGRVEAETIRFTRSDHTLFERAVREALLRSRYLPAEIESRRVRQMVEQAFSFALKR
ncbi:MAG: TonB family protein [Gemmatimonadaceae bacterium]